MLWRTATQAQKHPLIALSVDPQAQSFSKSFQMQHCITGSSSWRRMNATALRVSALLLLWMTAAFGLSTSALAQQAEPMGNDTAVRDPETSEASGESTFLTSQEIHWLAQHDGRIRIGITVIPPQVLRVDGQYQGLSIDYIHIMERKLGRAFKLVPFETWSAVIQAAKMRRIDMIFAAQRTPERLEYLLFTEPYIELPNMIVVRKDRKGGTSLKAMKGWRVATSKGSAVHEYLRREFPDIDPYPVPDELSGLMKVSVGEADAMVVEISRASYYIEKAGILNLRIAGNAGLLYRLRFAVRSDWPILGGILDKGLAAITEEERREITRRWIMAGQKSVFTTKAFWIPFAAGMTVIILAVAGVIQWNRTLSKVVRQRTSQLQQELAARRQADQDIALMSFALNSVSEAAFLIDEHACFSYVNEESCRVLGYPRDELLAKGVADVDPDFPVERWLDHWRELAARRTLTFESHHLTKDGRLLPVEINANYIEYGQKRYNLALVRDISERKKMERELVLREREYRTLVESVPDYIVRYGADLRRIYVNPAWERASGLSAAEVIGVPHTDIPIVPRPAVDDYVKKLREVMETGASQTTEFTWVNANGEKLFLEYAIVPEYDDQGAIAGVLAVGRDITDRKRAEEKMKVSEERLRMTLEATKIGIWDWDVAQARYYASPIYYAMLGYEPKEGLADRGEWLQRLHPDDRQTALDKVHKVLSGTSAAYSYEARFRHADGSYRWQRAFGYSAEYDKDGKVTRMLGLCMDIDQRKQMEQELSAYREHLEELVRERTSALEKSQEQIINLNQDLRSRAIALEVANKELDAFAYTASHDLRAPLRHIDGYIDLLQKTVDAHLDEQGRHYMHVISDSAQKMGQLIDDLLSFSRMGRYALSFQQLDLGALVSEIIDQLEANAAGRNIVWRIDELPTVSGDASMLRIVLGNLISNALKFTRMRQQAHIEIGSLSDRDAETVIFVRDNGAGFDMAYADKLFGVFQRLHRADEFEGTGIGLATVRRVIARHGGRTWANGQLDQGATFYFALPQQADKG
jgi:PAS domain S-box-containing protein